MKLKSIEIQGMRKIASKTYDFKDINYLMGENGAGKSTVIDAINLAILGYIPGTAKQNKKIMENSNGQVMSTTATLVGDGSTVELHRTWIQKGQSVESTFSVTPEGYDVNHLVENLELPVYNFSELLAKSANDQKDYFIKNILSASDVDVDIEKKISDKIADTKLDPKYTDGLKNEIFAEIIKYSKLPSVQLVQEINSYLKQMQSLKKAQIAEAEKTLSTLVKADDSDEVLRSSEEIKQDIQKKEDEISACKIHIAEESSLKRWEVSAGDLADEVDSFDVEADPRLTDEYLALVEARKSYDAKNNEINVKVCKLDEKIQSSEFELNTLSSTIRDLNAIVLSGGVCQYTKKQCPEIMKMIEKLKKQVEEHESHKADVEFKIADMKDSKRRLVESRKDLNEILADPQSAYDAISQKFTKLRTLKASKPKVSKYSGPELSLLEAEKSALDEEYKKAVNTETYTKLHDKLVASKSKYEVELDVIKMLIKYTGPNELQNELMIEPFNIFAERASKYIRELFVDDQLEMVFNLSNKANTFSFGLTRNISGYIPFNTLSSGEKCMYLIAFVMTVLELQEESKLKLVILDDVLDHLDKKNAKLVFENLAQLKTDLQFIFAGVIECKQAAVNKIKI